MDENDIPAEQTAPARKSVGEWSRAKKPAAWKLAGAAHAGKWEDEFPVITEAEFDAAIQAAGDIRIG